MRQIGVLIAFLMFSLGMLVSYSLAANYEVFADLSDDIATTDSQSISQTLAVDNKSRSSDGSLEKSGLEVVTNRRKVLTESSTLADVANEDVLSPQKTILVVQAANGKYNASTSQQNDSNCDQQQIGLTRSDSTSCWESRPVPPKGAPNIIYIVLDDVGFSQIGCFGGPIETPNMDRLAEGGLRYSNFHTTAVCAPTRACLLTGRNQHSTGIGELPEMSVGYPGYNGNLSKSTATIAEMLRETGYNTFALGKWHLASMEDI